MRSKFALHVYLPAHLKNHVEKLIREHPPGIKNFKKEKLYYILSLVYEIPAHIKNNGQWNGYTPIKAQYLKNVFYDYKLYINYLLENGILLCDHLAIDNKKSFGYKVNEELDGTIRESVINAPVIARSLKRNAYKQPHKASRKYPYLKKWFEGLEVDYDRAMQYIREKYRFLKDREESWDVDLQSGKRKNPLNQFNASAAALGYLKNKHYFFHVDKTAGRLHTNLANLPGELRNFITWKGKPLVSVDISNCQPYLSTLLFQPAFYDSNSLINYDTVINSIDSSDSHRSRFQGSLHTMQKSLQLIDKKEDIANFKAVVYEGNLYEYMLHEFNSKKLIEGEVTRKKMKQTLFMIFYSANQFIGQPDAVLKRQFRALFPTVYEVFALYKRGHANLLPIMLQKIEAILILDIITKRIHNERPEAPIFTIHDSIVTTGENLEYVKKIILEEAEKIIGVAPHLKLEYFKPENVEGKYSTELRKQA